jgi:hypothetical protein
MLYQLPLNEKMKATKTHTAENKCFSQNHNHDKNPYGLKALFFFLKQ